MGLLQQLISINIDLDGFTIYGKWLFMVPFMCINFMIWVNGVVPFFRKCFAKKEKTT